MAQPNTQTAHQQVDLTYDKLLSLLHSIEPQVASLTADYNKIAQCVKWNTSVHGFENGRQFSEIYVKAISERLGLVSASLTDAGNHYMALVLAGVCPADKIETIEDGLRSLRADHDSIRLRLRGIYCF